MTEYISCPEEPVGIPSGSQVDIEAACRTLGATIVRGRAHLPGCRCHGTGKVKATKLVSAEEALWPIIRWAARQNCLSPIVLGMLREDKCGKCETCLARKFTAEVKP